VKRLGLVFAIAVVALGGAFLTFRGSRSSDGPVFAGTGSSATGQRLSVGESVSFGYVFLRNTAKTPATLESVRLLGITDGLELLGVRSRPVPDEQGRGMFLGVAGYPPTDWLSNPLESHHVVPVSKTFLENGNPEEGLELVIGVRATRPGVARARAVEFTYKVSGRRYREVYDGSMYLCAPTENFTAETCPGDTRDKFDDVNLEVKIPT
jgi:hypothetical protein